MVITVSTAVFMGRFNIPTPSHASLIKELANSYNTVIVYLSSATPTDWNSRVLLLHSLIGCHNVVYRSAPNMYRAFEQHRSEPDTFLIAGEDRNRDIEQLAKRFNLNFHVFPRHDGMSSTFIRSLIDSNDLNALAKYYTDDQIIQVLVLRAQESVNQFV